jgi:class 3 adenylate cyclase
MSAVHQLIPAPARATVLFTDIVGSTRHAVELGDLEWRRLLERHDRLVRDEVAIAGGRVVKNMGDGYLVAFDDATSAVACAHALVIAARSVGLEIRAGLHSGEVHLLGDDLVGVTLHIAARVCALAGAGRVLVTAAVAEQARNCDGPVIDHGPVVLRDLPGEFRLFERAHSAALAA